MNKSKIVLAVIGGVTLVGALVAGFFLWQAANAKTIAIEGDFDEGVDGLDTVMQKAAALARKSVFPSQDSVNIYAKDRDMFEEWRSEALNLASRGDKKFAETTSGVRHLLKAYRREGDHGSQLQGAQRCYVRHSLHGSRLYLLQFPPG